MSWYHGNPCKNCGTTKKRTSNSGCINCHREADRRRAKKRYSAERERERRLAIEAAERERIRFLAQFAVIPRSEGLKEFHDERRRR